MGFAWTPKATVQAAVGSMVLDRAKAEGLTEYLPYGVKSLTASILSILITAPMGALLMATLGPRWLTKADTPVSSIRGSMYAPSMKPRVD